MADSVLVWPVTRFDGDVSKRWGVQTDAYGVFPTAALVSAVCADLELGSLAAALTLTRAIAEKCGPQVLAFTSGGAHVVVCADTALADVKAAFAVAHETALVL